ncbi:MAG: GatB/YqeY domain-containing protein [bacterium]|nr:GatB/YqeY domain-containing protein [bacterium]
MLNEQLGSDLKEAMKSKDELKLSTLRLLKTAMKNKEIELGHELSEDESVAVIKSQVKALKDSLTSFQDAGRDDLALKAKDELVILETYLPEEMGDDVLTELVKDVLKEIGVENKADMGKAIGAVMKKVAGQADGTRVKNLVEQLLS